MGLFIFGLLGTTLFLLSLAQLYYFKFVDTGGWGGVMFTILCGIIAPLTVFSLVFLWQGIGKITKNLRNNKELFNKIRIAIICFCVAFEIIYVVSIVKWSKTVSALYEGESLLVEIDEELTLFAESKKIHIEKRNEHKMFPERILEWEKDGLIRYIIIRDDKIDKKYKVTLGANTTSQETERRYINFCVMHDAPFSEISESLPKLLEDSYVIANSWVKEDLQNNHVRCSPKEQVQD